MTQEAMPEPPCRTWKITYPDHTEEIIEGHYCTSNFETGTIEIFRITPKRHQIVFAINLAPGTSVRDVTP